MMRKTHFLMVVLLVLVAALLPASTVSADVIGIEVVSVDSAGVQGIAGSNQSAISADGRYVVFVSFASNLVSGDTNGTSDIFVHDRQTGTIERVSVGAGGTQANDASNQPDISADGRYVVFESNATNLIGADTNGETDIFVHDRNSGFTIRASLANGPTGAEGNGSSNEPRISDDGQLVAFQTDATNLFPGDGNNETDVLVRDIINNTTEVVSVNNAGTEGNDFSGDARISGDGQFVGFTSAATNLVVGDGNGTNDVFVRDIINNTTERVSVSSVGAEGNGISSLPSLSFDGQYVAFTSNASNLVAGDTNNTTDVFVHNRNSDNTVRVSVSSGGAQGDDQSRFPDISADGRYISFGSFATTLVTGDTNSNLDIFLHDRMDGETERVSISVSGAEGDGNSGQPVIALENDRQLVAFNSTSTNLIDNDTNGEQDIFVTTLGVPGVPPTITSAAPSNGTVGVNYSHTYTATGDTPISYSVNSGALPDGLTLSGDTISGTPTTAGTFTGEVTASNADGSDTQAFSITIAAAPVAPTITSDPPGDGVVGTAYTHTYTATGDTPITYSVSSGALPDGLTLSGNTISGTPTTAGTFTGEVTASNNAGTDTQAFSITITDDPVTVDPPVRLYPADGQTVTAANSGDWQPFQFEHLDGAEWYGLWIGTTTPSVTTAIYQWFPATATSAGITTETPICNTTTMVCTLPVDVWLVDGDYEWWMTYWGTTLPDWNTYWNDTTFSVDFAAPSPGALTGVTPSGTVNTAPTEVTWDRDPNVLWMQIWLGQVVGPDGTPYTAFYGWVDATEICDATTCTLALDASVLPIPDGDYEMWMRLWGPGGFLGWTDVNDTYPAATFSVETN